MLDFLGNKTTPVCGFRSKKCYESVEDSLLKFEANALEESTNDEGNNMNKCNCLPACTSITYDAEISQIPHDFQKSIMQTQPELTNELNISIVTLSDLFIFFTENQFMTSKRSELFGTTDFLANCGGLLGLFMGVSLLSIVELIYFCTLRFCGNSIMEKFRIKKPQKEETEFKLSELVVHEEPIIKEEVVDESPGTFINENSSTSNT